METVDSKVPHGSVLGPGLFITLINDLEKIEKSGKFSDHTTQNNSKSTKTYCEVQQHNHMKLNHWADEMQYWCKLPHVEENRPGFKYTAIVSDLLLCKESYDRELYTNHFHCSNVQQHLEKQTSGLLREGKQRKEREKVKRWTGKDYLVFLVSQ